MNYLWLAFLLAAATILAGVLFFIFLPAFIPRVENFNYVTLGGKTLLVEVASDPLTRARGLSGRKSMADLGGMLFLFDKPGIYQFWMKDMHFPIDIFWIHQGAIVDLEEYVPPPLPGIKDSLLPLYQSDVPADMVLETKVGFAARNNIKIVDEIKFFSSPASLRPTLSEGDFDKNGNQAPSHQQPKVLRVKFFSQAPLENWDYVHEGACEEATILLADQFWERKNLSLESFDQNLVDLVKRGKEKFGHSPDIKSSEIARLANDLNPRLNARVLRVSALNDIKKEIDSGRPLIAPVDGRVLSNPHYGPTIGYHTLLVIGYSDKEIIVHDPGTKAGKNYRYQNEIFWRALGDLYTRDKNIVVFRPQS